MTAQEYEEWIKHFEAKHTTDECFTPAEVYENVLQFVKKHWPEQLEGKRIIRPFYPGGDYEHADYTNAVVVDNPPFSIMSKIVKFYTEKKIPFFLFAYLNTLFNTVAPGYVICYDSVTYENGAVVATGFVTSFFHGIIGIKGVQKKNRETHSKVEMPDGYASAAQMRKDLRLLEDGEEKYWNYAYGSRIRKTPAGKSIFGCAYKIKEVDKL